MDKTLDNQVSNSFQNKKSVVKKTKVLFLIHTLGGGGAEKILVDIVKSLDARRFDITVMTVINTGIYISQLPKHVHYKTIFGKGIKTDKNAKSVSGSLNSKSVAKFTIVPKIYNFIWKIMPTKLLYKIAVKEKYDTEVAFLEGISAKIIASSNNKNSKKIAWIHVDFSNEHKSKEVFVSADSEKKCYDEFDKIICVSEETRNGFQKTINPKSPAEVIHNFIDAKHLISLSEKNKIKKTENKPLTVSVVGRLTHQKGQDRLLEAVSKLKKEGYEDFLVQLVGDGHNLNKLQKYAKEKSLNNVVFLGYKDTVYKLMLQSDLCFITSRAEGFSTVMAEAILLSRPILSTKVSGTDWLPPQLVISNNKAAIYQALKSIVSDKNYYQDILKYNKNLKSKFLKINLDTMKKLERVLI